MCPTRSTAPGLACLPTAYIVRGKQEALVSPCRGTRRVLVEVQLHKGDPSHSFNALHNPSWLSCNPSSVVQDCFKYGEVFANILQETAL